MKKIYSLSPLFLITGTALLLNCPPLFSETPKSSSEKITGSLYPSDNNPLPTTASDSKEEDIAGFTPPKGWRLADEKSLPSTVKVMVIGKSRLPFPPSINLGTEPYKGTLKQYLKIIKAMNDSQGYEWKDLGIIKTESGPASLSQVDTQTEWGDVRMMHAILLKNGHIYILTCSALKEEFSKFYDDFFKSMKTLKITRTQ